MNISNILRALKQQDDLFNSQRTHVFLPFCILLSIHICFFCILEYPQHALTAKMSRILRLLAAYLFHLRESSFSFLSLAQVVEALGEFEISEGQFISSDALYNILIGGNKRQ